MEHMNKENELVALRVIAETLNTSNDIHQMLDKVLKKLLEVTGLTTGWVFLVDEKPEYTCAVDYNLPPALTWGNKTPMCQDECWCIGRYWKGTLKHAVNIINCKRIEDAIEYKWGDTNGITHHATVPLEAGGEMFGILNVAAPGKEHFDDAELALLQSIAYQIGTAVKRARLYHAQQKRADGYVKLGQITERLYTYEERPKIIEEAVALAGKLFEWPMTAVFMKEGQSISLRSFYDGDNERKCHWHSLPISESGLMQDALVGNKRIHSNENETMENVWKSFNLEHYPSFVLVPLRIHGEAYGLLTVASPKKNAFDQTDAVLIEALARYIAIALENARLYEQRRDLAKVEERNRLARDLHDSVCQTLFSLNLTARASQLMISGQQEQLTDSLQEIQIMTDSALKQMRSLIWQLRPGELEEGLVTALKKYGERLGLPLNLQLNGVKELPRNMEEALWRIGQECLNNVSKHAKSTNVDVILTIGPSEVSMEVVDDGIGFDRSKAGTNHSMGMIGMRERIDQLQGTLAINSQEGKGTQVKVILPLKHERNEGLV